MIPPEVLPDDAEGRLTLFLRLHVLSPPRKVEQQKDNDAENYDGHIGGGKNYTKQRGRPNYGRRAEPPDP